MFGFCVCMCVYCVAVMHDVFLLGVFLLIQGCRVLPRGVRQELVPPGCRGVGMEQG